MGGLFENLDDALYEMANKSDSNTLQNIYFDSMRELRKRRAGIDQDFNREVLRIYDRFWETGEVNVVTASLDELSKNAEMALLEDDELEDSLAITNMISKADNRYTRELYAMGQRFAHIIGSGQVDEHFAQQTPLSPVVLCAAFQTSFVDVPVELPVKLVVYKLFDRHVMHFIGGLYDEINILLGKAGVIPKLTPRVRRNPISPVILPGEGGNSHVAGESSYIVEPSAQSFYGESQTVDVQGEVFVPSSSCWMCVAPGFPTPRPPPARC